MRLALEAEGKPKINLDTWEKSLKSHGNFRVIYHAAKGKFLDASMQRLAEAEDLKHLRWLIERRFPDLFARPDLESAAVVNISQVNNTVAIPADVLSRAREIADKQNH